MSIFYGNEAYAGDPIWTDLHNLAWSWSGTATPLTADGYPLASSSTAFNLTNYPDGVYQFSYTGTATVAFSDIGQLAGPVTLSGARHHWHGHRQSPDRRWDYLGHASLRS